MNASIWAVKASQARSGRGKSQRAPDRDRRSKEGGRSSALRPRAHLVDELEAILVGRTLVGELNGVEREGGGRVERDDAGSEDSSDLSSQRGKEFVSTHPAQRVFSRQRARRIGVAEGSRTACAA